jgi:4-coumarate--CoA ligase (photoactive yellow protein activation family)
MAMLPRPLIAGLLEDRLRAEIATSSGLSLPARPWPDTLNIGTDGLGVDSLERMTLATVVHEMFDLHAAGAGDLLLARPRFGDWIDLVQAALNRSGARIGFRTSGSQGTPRLYHHALTILLDEARLHALRLPAGRILSAVPAHHIYGFIFTVLLPALTKRDVTDIRAGTPVLRADDIIVSYPDHWRFLASVVPAFPAIAGITSAAPMPADLWRQLRSQGLANLLEVYGSTETAGLAWRASETAPFTLLPGWAVLSGDGETLRIRSDNAGVMDAPDDVVMTEARSFHLRHRHDGAVQVGGVNVWPQRIEAVLRQHPCVGQARVRLDPASGRLKALLVRQSGTGLAPKPDSLRAWLATRLTVPEQPRSFVWADALPIGVMGKPGDWSAAQEGSKRC